MAKNKKISRRRFIVRSTLGGTAIILGATYLARNPLRRKIAEMANTAELPYVGNTDDPIMWFEVGTDNSVTLHCPKVEMGQGTFTGLAQIAAEELEISMDQIKVVHASTDTGNIDGLSTGGSNSISSLWITLRELAATMREMLKAEASKKLQVPLEKLTAENGYITAQGHKISYGDIVKDTIDWEIPDVPVLKKPSEFRHIGKAVRRVDLMEKVRGDAIFGMDVELPGMLYGAILRPTAIGATLVSADTSAAEALPGIVSIVVEEDFIGVVAKSYTEAENAKEAIDAKWNTEKIWQTGD
ncbi:MAG: molybdopterin cofactor-binding domain-containing protein, partial [Flavobacteriaceae bacterium]